MMFVLKLVIAMEDMTFANRWMLGIPRSHLNKAMNAFPSYSSIIFYHQCNLRSSSIYPLKWELQWMKVNLVAEAFPWKSSAQKKSWVLSDQAF